MIVFLLFLILLAILLPELVVFLFRCAFFLALVGFSIGAIWFVVYLIAGNV